MKKLYLFLFLLTNSIFAQDFNDSWKKVYQYEIDGKIKSAGEVVDNIYKKAKRKKDEEQIIKCFFYKSKFLQVVDENANKLILNNLKSEIKESKGSQKSILSYIYVSILEKFYNSNRYYINPRTSIENYNSNDYLTWTKTDFDKEIKSYYSELLVNENDLRKKSIKDYIEIFDSSPYIDLKNYSIYEFLMNKVIDFNYNKIDNYNFRAKSINDNYFKTPKDFINLKTDTISNENFKTIIETYQKNERYYSAQSKTDLDLKYFNRLEKLHTLNDEKDNFYSNLFSLEKSTTNDNLKQSLRFKRAEYYFNKTYKESEKTYYKQVLITVDSILKNRENPDAKAEAENLKEKILKKEISIQLPSKVYPNQNYRAIINSKNIDTLRISYYKISSKIFQEINKLTNYNYETRTKKDSLIQSCLLNNKAIKTSLKSLPLKDDHFNYSYDLLMDNLDVGNYLLFFEAKNEFGGNDKIAFAHHLLQVSNIEYLTELDDNNDLFYLLDRKTGKPIENVTAINNTETVTSDKTGKISFKKLEEIDKKYTYTELRFIKENDTIITNYYKNIKNFTKEEEDIEAKAMVYFDRAIYRPGQKLYYKGYIIQNEKKIKNVVPFLSVHVTIEDSNDETLKEFDVQTNEFGSFSGEFDIPKSVLTGQFNFTIEEPDDYEIDTKYYDKKEDKHLFWDNVDFNNYNDFKFQVEEYKRPTFEITFDKIKENYTIGDTITITGNAKTLAGTNLTNSKVSYSVSKYVDTFLEYENKNLNRNFLNTETTTDENGNFKIEWKAIQDSISNDKIERLNYTIKVSITDLNGETRTASSSIDVGKKMLKLNCSVNQNLFIEDKNILTISATTLNDYPINTKGKIRFYEKKGQSFLINKIQIPEIHTINKEDFTKLFPFEPYDKNDYTTTEEEVYTLDFDTEKSSEIDLAFLKKLDLTDYTIKISATDKNNNLIEDDGYFNLKSKEKPVSVNKLFAKKYISNKNEIIYELYSQIPDLYVTTRIYDDETKKDEKVIQLKNGFGIVKFPNSKNYQNDTYLHFSTFWENNYYSDQILIDKNSLQNTNLEFEIVSMRNKIKPGSKENWSFKIKNAKQEAEVLASMYDSSLDQFATSTWEELKFHNRNNEVYPEYKVDYHQNIEFNNLDYYNKYFINYRTQPYIKWFGFDFVNPKNPYYTTEYIKSVKKSSIIPKNAKMVYGVVADATGPLPGVNVVVKGTTRGTQTDFDGVYQIEAVEGEVLEFTFIGLKDHYITVDKNKNFNVILNADNVLDEVVVTAFGIKKAPRELAYASQIVKNEEIEQAAPLNIITALQGKVSGLNILTKNNGVNPSTGIVLRGYKSLSGNNYALIVIDGVIQTNYDLSSLSPDDILSINAMKAEKATVLYGSQGANGALIIITKKGITQLTQVKTRTNFNETAFFYPNLITDSNGQINFSFTTPESLTKWKLRLFAHNKSAETGTSQSEIISQKDIMVMPNMPRFVREKDVINIAAKIVNMTYETKSGNAVLLLFDATNDNPIDTIALNKNNIKNFNCKSKQSVAVNWLVTIPEGIQAIRYKVIAKSGNVSDGEENILPVLTNKILITESIPIWVKGNTKREFTFTNLKNNTSSTLQNHALTFEYTSNPIWFALQSLPFLMDYEHECAEQTFARYYSNCIAEKIVSSNPKIEKLFTIWKDKKTPDSKLNLNEELKSIILAETPWSLDSEGDDEKNKKLALQFNLDKLKEKNQETFKKLEDKMLPTGGFPWFDGGNENPIISQHILAGIGHLNTLFPEEKDKNKNIVTKGIPNLDAKFIQNYSKKSKIINPSVSQLHYLYMRSFYLNDYPVSKKCDSLIQLQLKQCKENWLDYSLYKKGLLALTMNRFGEKDFAKKIITSLKETVSNNEEIGMYWIENTNGYGWYESAIETQALLIEAFAEIDKNQETIDAMKVWLIKNKQTKRWATTKATTEAIYALISKGSDWTSIKENTKIKIGDEKILSKKLLDKNDEQETGYLKLQFNKEEITPKMSTISIDNKTKVPGFGGVYWQYFEDLESIKKDSTSTLSLDKKIFKKVTTTTGEELIELDKQPIAVGDLLTIRLIIRTNTNLEFVHLKDLRASCFEPVDVISKYNWKGELGYYQSTKDVAINFFFDTIDKGTYVLEYNVRVTNLGTFNSGVSTLQSMYSPEYSTHSENSIIKVTK